MIESTVLTSDMKCETSRLTRIDPRNICNLRSSPHKGTAHDRHNAGRQQRQPMRCVEKLQHNVIHRMFVDVGKRVCFGRIGCPLGSDLVRCGCCRFGVECVVVIFVGVGGCVGRFGCVYRYRHFENGGTDGLRSYAHIWTFVVCCVAREIARVYVTVYVLLHFSEQTAKTGYRRWMTDIQSDFSGVFVIHSAIRSAVYHWFCGKKNIRGRGNDIISGAFVWVFGLYTNGRRVRNYFTTTTVKWSIFSLNCAANSACRMPPKIRTHVLRLSYDCQTARHMK